MSDREDDLQPNATSLQALITPIVAVLLILAGVVLSVLLSGTGYQNEAAAVRSQQLIDSAFRAVGRDLGEKAQALGGNAAARDAANGSGDWSWLDREAALARVGLGSIDYMVVAGDDRVLYDSDGRTGMLPDTTVRGLAKDARDGRADLIGWTSAFVKHQGRLHVAGASPAPGGAEGVVIVALRLVDDSLLAILSNEYLLDGISVQPASDFAGRAGIVISSPAGGRLAAITWNPPRPGDELFDYMLVPILIASLIAAMLLVTFLRTAVRAAQQYKRGAAALAESGEALEYSESMLAAIIHGVADGIVSFDGSGRITSANASMSRIFGYSREEMVGQPVDMLLAGSGDEGQTLKSSISFEGTKYQEFTGKRRDNGRFVLDTAISHITYQSQAVAIAIMRDITERKQAEETLNLLATGMALVDRDCRLLLANRSAARVLNSGDGLLLSHGRINASARETAEHLRNLVYGVCTGTGGEDDVGAGVMTIERNDSVRPLSLKVAPVQLNAGDDSSKVAAIFIRDLEVRQTVPPEVVAKLFGLTSAEARVVVELVKGKRPQEVAEEHGVSVNTVRNQLKQIFSKTNTGRQSELVSLVLSSAAFVSEHGLDDEDGEATEIELTGS